MSTTDSIVTVRPDATGDCDSTSVHHASSRIRSALAILLVAFLGLVVMPLANAGFSGPDLSFVGDPVQSPSDPVVAGSSVSYSVTVANTGDTSGEVIIDMTDDVSDGDFKDGDCTNTDFVFNCGSLADGESATYRFELQDSLDETISFTIQLFEGSDDTLLDSRVVESIVAENVTNAADDVATTDTDTPVTIDVLENDSGTNGAGIDGPEIISGPSNGSAKVNSDDTITYTPSGGFVGTDSFVYRIESGGISDDATVTVIVGPVEGPFAVDDSASTPSGAAVTIDVLNNDFGTGGAAVSLVEVTSPPRGGAANENPDGTITYTPSPGFSGTDTFTYTITDGSAQDTAEVTVNVGAAPPGDNPRDPNLSGIPGLSETQQSVANALDATCASTSNSALLGQCGNLARLGDVQAKEALNEIAPRKIIAQGSQAVEVTGAQLNNVQARQRSLRTAELLSSQVALQGFSVSWGEYSMPVGALADAVMQGNGNADQQRTRALSEQPLSPGLIADWIALESGGGASSDDPLGYSRWGMFLNGRLNFGDKRETERESGFDFNTLGLTLGADYRFTPNLVFGGALGYAQTDSDYTAAGGNLETTSTHATLYGSFYSSGGMFVDGAISFGKNDYDSNRNITYTGVNTTAVGKTDGDQLGISLNAGGEMDLGNGAFFVPYLRTEYIDLDVAAYSESGGAGLALAIDDQSVTSWTGNLAMELYKVVSTTWGILIPSFYAEWEHQFKDNVRGVTARFADDPRVPFTIPTDKPDRNYFNLGFSLSATMRNRWSAFISYETVIDQTDWRRNTIDFGVRKEF